MNFRTQLKHLEQTLLDRSDTDELEYAIKEIYAMAERLGARVAIIRYAPPQYKYKAHEYMTVAEVIAARFPNYRVKLTKVCADCRNGMFPGAIKNDHTTKKGQFWLIPRSDVLKYGVANLKCYPIGAHSSLLPISY